MGLREGLLHDRDDGKDMLAGGDLGKDAAKTRVNIHLGGNHRGEAQASILKDGASGLVTG
jgi:hypothetical protein